MYEVVDISNDTLGYIVSDVFISKSRAKYLICGVVKSTSSTCGIFINQNILTSLGLFKDLYSLRSIDDCIRVLSAIDREVYLLQEVTIFPIKPEYVHSLEMDIFWNACVRLGTDYHTYSCIDTLNGVEIAYLLTLEDIFISDRVHIGMLECIDKRKQWGSRVVSYLRSLGKHITGLSVSNARIFWEKQGAVFHKNNYFEIY